MGLIPGQDVQELPGGVTLLDIVGDVGRQVVGAGWPPLVASSSIAGASTGVRAADSALVQPLVLFGVHSGDGGGREAACIIQERLRHRASLEMVLADVAGFAPARRSRSRHRGTCFATPKLRCCGGILRLHMHKGTHARFIYDLWCWQKLDLRITATIPALVHPSLALGLQEGKG